MIRFSHDLRLVRRKFGTLNTTSRDSAMARPQFEFIPNNESRALVFKIDRDIWPVYHYHPEFDILYSLKDHAGEFISGDHIGQLEKGTLFMNGPNIPHGLQSGRLDENDWKRPSLAVVQFSEGSLGREMLQKTDLESIRNFLAEAKFGFQFHGACAEEAGRMILQMEDQSPLEQFLQLLRILDFFSKSEEKTKLASPAYSPSLREKDISRIDRVLQYIRQRRAESVRLEEAAAVAAMSPKSFCRFFKANTGKTLIQYLNELRIGEACRMLVETDQPVSEIALDSGFNNLSNFNRRFREIKGETPRKFRSKIRLSHL